MLRQEDKQWLDEKDIVDRYLLDQLTDEEKKHFESILAYSEQLKDELAVEATMVAAIREYSRTEMKRRLKEAIQQSETKVADESTDKRRSVHHWMYIRAAAVILLFLGGAWLLYLRMAEEKSPAPVAEEFISKPGPVKEKIQQPPRQETISEYREPQKNEQPVKRIKTRRVTDERKPLVLSVPADSAHNRFAQKFPVSAALFPRPNETKAILDLPDDQLQTETRIVFKNPTDLTAVNLVATAEEKNGLPEWFYIHWDQPVLNVYLDYTRHLNFFKNAKLIRQKQHMLIVLEKYTYLVLLEEGTKFNKAVISK